MNERIKHICEFCTNKKCPEAGSIKYDGMLGPTIGCLRYRPPIWTAIVNWLILIGLITTILYTIYVFRAFEIL